MPQPNLLPFFIYGTLLPDQPNFFLWGDSIVAITPATFFGGKLYDMGFYPMLVTANPEAAVQGQLITVATDAYELVLQRLDALEGYDPTQPDKSAYQRRQVTVILADGRSTRAWLYQGQPDLVSGRPELPDGNWAAYSAQSRLDLQVWWETIDTVAGLHTEE